MSKEFEYGEHIYTSVFTFPVLGMPVGLSNGDRIPLTKNTVLQDSDGDYWRYDGNYSEHVITNGWRKVDDKR